MTTQEILEALIKAVFTGEQRDELLADLEKREPSYSGKGETAKADDTLKTNASGASSTTIRKA